MHAPGLPALPAAARAARIPRAAAAGLHNSRHASPTRQHAHAFHTRPSSAAAPTRQTRTGAQSISKHTQCLRRDFHASAMRLSTADAAAAAAPEGDGNGNGKPGSGTPVLEKEGEVGAHMTAGGRSKLTAANSLRSRQARRRNASVLPPVQLPSRFLDRNVHIHDPTTQPVVPLAIAHDVKKNPKPGVGATNKSTRKRDRRIRKQYFEAACDVVTARLTRGIEALESRILLLKGKDREEGLDPELEAELTIRLQELSRLQSALSDCLNQYAAIASEDSVPLEDYNTRPFWWWAINGWGKHRFNAGIPKEQIMDFVQKQLALAERFDLAPAQTMSDFDMWSFDSLRQHLTAELQTKAPSSFDPKTARRPISILLNTGYEGKAFATSVIRHMAHITPAHVVELDAYDLASVVGSYLGQDAVYSQGSLSLLGYRAAEMNGRLPVPESSTNKGSRSNDDDDFIESQFLTVRGPSSQGEDLQKASPSDYGVFSKWDSLKIDKILDYIIRSAESKSASSEKASAHQKTIIHLHDYVELGMTLEGHFLISRLRALVDAAWHQGRQIVLVGSSSCDSMSDEYSNMVRDISLQDSVIKVPFDEASRSERHSIERSDRFLENVANIERMVDAMEPVGSHAAFKDKEALLDFAHQLHEPTLTNPGGVSRLLETVLPAPVVYRLAQMYRSIAMSVPESQEAEGAQSAEIRALSESTSLFPFWLTAPRLDRSRWSDISSESPKPKDSEEEPGLWGDQDKRLAGLNEYEKRISNGIISKEKLHVSFDDVHAPKETTSALKLLTTLTLQRPDAFSYGILKHDKINGCLLYGPPGTGKTMLAKAVAKDCGANMLEVSGATINDKYVGESEKLIRAVFSLAKRLSPCVIFIDEADALLANRSMGLNRTVHRELINQFLRQWDGIVETNAFIMVATNRPFDLDDAVLRRLPRKLLMDLPTKDDRAALLKLLLRGEQLEPGVSLTDLASRTPFYSGSDLKNMCVAAAMSAVEEENNEQAAFVQAGGSAEDYKHPAKRTLRKEHFEKGLLQIPASISEDMPSLKMIRKFDEEYGDGKKGNRRKGKGMGFGMMPDEEQAVKEVKIRA